MTKTQKTAARKPRARKKKPAEDSLERILELLDDRVESRGAHERGRIEDTEAIVDLVEAALKRGATMPELAKRVKRYDRNRGMVKITRQALVAMLRAESDTSQRDARAAESRRRAQEMHEFYMQGHSARDTGKHFGGLAAQTVLAAFYRHGLETRPIHGPRPRSIARGHLNTEALS